MGKLSKSPEEFLLAKGWSASLFLEHARLAFNELQGKAIVDVGRSVIHTMTNDVVIKCYVHYQGKTPEYVTFVDGNKQVVESHHHSVSPEELVKRLKVLLRVK